MILKLSAFAVISLAVLLAPARGAFAQGNPVTDTLRMGFSDIADIKHKAESGDPAAQLALGDSLASHFPEQPAENADERAHVPPLATDPVMPGKLKCPQEPGTDENENPVVGPQQLGTAVPVKVPRSVKRCKAQ